MAEQALPSNPAIPRSPDEGRPVIAAEGNASPDGGDRGQKGSASGGESNSSRHENTGRPKIGPAEGLGTKTPDWIPAGPKPQPPGPIHEAKSDVRSPEFAQELAEWLRGQTARGDGVIHLRLKPGGMGHLEIRAEKGPEGLIARIQTESGEVQHLLERCLGMLENGLAERGLKVERIEILLQDQASPAGTGGSSHGPAGGPQEGRGGPRSNSGSPSVRDERAAPESDAPIPEQQASGHTFHTIA